jgi:isopenicillin N synthase-like dioxygenase
VIPDSEFKDPLLEYHRSLSSLADRLMSVLGDGLSDFDTSIFSEFCKEPVASVRLLHYPPHPKNGDPNLRGAGAHTDFGAITLLLQDDSSGLQVFNNNTDEWINVPPNRDAYVVNVGDMLDRWTKGEYRSTIHRVINTSGTDRYSVPFFFDGNLDCVLKPLDGSGSESLTVEQHMNSRYKAAYVV